MFRFFARFPALLAFWIICRTFSGLFPPKHAPGVPAFGHMNTSEIYMESPDGKVFGFIPKEVMLKRKDRNWRLRVSAIVDIENLVV